MYRRLRVAIPVIQVLAAIVVFSLVKFYGSSRFYEYYLGDAQGLVIGLNFPLVVFWVLVFSPIKWFTSYLPPLTGGLTAGTVALVVLLASSVALFWYLVVSEIAMRRHGKTLLSFSTFLWQLLTVVILLCCGVGATFYSYWVSRPIWYARPTDAILSGFFPAIWGVVLIGIAIHDLVISLRNRREPRDKQDASSFITPNR